MQLRQAEIMFAACLFFFFRGGQPSHILFSTAYAYISRWKGAYLYRHRFMSAIYIYSLVMIIIITTYNIS